MSRHLRLADGRVRARRIANDRSIVVESRTIGTEMVYNLETDNLSRTGMLLNTASYRKVPFQVNTILEVTVDTRGSVFTEPVQCLAKVVRMEEVVIDDPEDDDLILKRYGVAIVQIEGNNIELWEKVVAQMERDATGSSISQTMEVAA